NQRPPRGPRPNNGQRPQGGNPRGNSPRGNNNRGAANSAPNKNDMSGGLRKSSRGAAMRAQKRTIDDATRQINQVLDLPKSGEAERPRANYIDDRPVLKIIGLGGMDGGGSKNMIL